MSFQIILLALTAHPDAQHQAQAEIDAVFGSDNTLPDKIDLEKLPYLNACVTEALRWRPLGAYPVGPFGLPRETVADQEILGYHIPKGTTVLINQWTIAHDPEFYEEPDRYMPERFVRDPVGAKDGVSQLGREALYTWGAGRRKCPGKDFFLQNVRIAFAQILWAFDIIPDEALDINVRTGFSPAIVLTPKPFKVKFVPRRTGTREAVLEEKRKADKMLSEMLA
jgi:cytochrome P450